MQIRYMNCIVMKYEKLLLRLHAHIYLDWINNIESAPLRLIIFVLMAALVTLQYLITKAKYMFESM